MQISIHSASDEFPELRLTTFGTKEIFRDLREVSSRRPKCLPCLDIGVASDLVCKSDSDVPHRSPSACSCSLRIVASRPARSPDCLSCGHLSCLHCSCHIDIIGEDRSYSTKLVMLKRHAFVQAWSQARIGTAVDHHNDHIM